MWFNFARHRRILCNLDYKSYVMVNCCTTPCRNPAFHNSWSTNINVNNANIRSITRQSKMSVCLATVTINMITTLSMIISCWWYFQFSLLRFVFSLCFRLPFWRSWLSTLVLLLQKLYLAFFDIERTWRKLFQKRIARTKFDIYSLVFVFARCFDCLVLPVALDYIFL